jgi:hypothetical protein
MKVHRQCLERLRFTVAAIWQSWLLYSHVEKHISFEEILGLGRERPATEPSCHFRRGTVKREEEKNLQRSCPSSVFFATVGNVV